MIFSTAFSVLFPLFAKIALGYGIRSLKILCGKTLKEMNNVVFRVFLPTLLFSNIYKTDFSTITSFNLLWYSVLSLIVMVSFYMLLIPRLEPENAKRGVLVQGICRSNFIFFGMPMAATLYGGTSAGIASLMVGIGVPMINMLSVIILEYFRGNKPDLKNILKGIVLNPIVIGGALGLLCAIVGIKLPPSLEGVIFEIADIATPLALVILGASVTFSSVKVNRKPLIIGILNRLVVVPAVGITIAILVGYRDLELILLMAMYAMAQQMDGDAEPAGQIVVFTTALSLLSLFFWISLLMALGYF
jgi:predicted permease